jgi:hypothetical protein
MQKIFLGILMLCLSACGFNSDGKEDLSFDKAQNALSNMLFDCSSSIVYYKITDGENENLIKSYNTHTHIINDIWCVSGATPFGVDDNILYYIHNDGQNWGCYQANILDNTSQRIYSIDDTQIMGLHESYFLVDKKQLYQGVGEIKQSGIDKKGILLKENIWTAAVYNDVLYYSPRNEPLSLYALSIKDNVEQIIFSEDKVTSINDKYIKSLFDNGMRLIIKNVVPYHDNIYFVISNSDTSIGALYCYNGKNKNIEPVLKSSVMQFHISDGVIYYTEYEDRKFQLKKCNMSGKGITYLKYNTSTFCLYDNRIYFYDISHDEKRFISVDTDGKDEIIIDCFKYK